MLVLQAIAAASIVAGLVYLAAVTVAALIVAMRCGGRREEPADDQHALSSSRFVVPVSVVVPLTAAADPAQSGATIAGLLGLTYPAFEVLVIAEELPSAVWERLKFEWALEARELFYRAALATAPIRMIYRSTRDARLMFVHKEPGPAADALNCGVNLARFRYVCAIEPGVTFGADALLRAMTPALADPAGVVAAVSHVETGGGALQRLSSARSLMESRVVWRRLGTALGPPDAVVLWRRDALELAGGFSIHAADPQLEMMARLQSATMPDDRGRVVRTADIFGHRDGTRVAGRVQSMVRRQTALLQALAWLRTSRRHRRLVSGYVIAAEVITPCVEGWIVAAAALAAAAGWLSWFDGLLVVAMLACRRAAISAAALLLRGALPDPPPDRHLRRLLALAPLEFFAFGAAAAYARVAGFRAWWRSRGAALEQTS